MKRKILIVDDEQSIADLVEVYLSNEGMEVLKCYNGQDALDCIKRKDFLGGPGRHKRFRY